MSFSFFSWKKDSTYCSVMCRLLHNEGHSTSTILGFWTSPTMACVVRLGALLSFTWLTPHEAEKDYNFPFNLFPLLCLDSLLLMQGHLYTSTTLFLLREHVKKQLSLCASMSTLCTYKCNNRKLSALWSRFWHEKSHYLALAKPPEPIWYDECAISFVSTQPVNYNLYQ